MERTKLLHTQKLRFVIDVEVSVRDVPQALIDGSAVLSQYKSWQNENPEEFKEFVKFQQRLLDEVLRDSDATLRLAIEKAGNKAADSLSAAYTTNSEPSDEEILSEVLNKLNLEDKKRIQSAKKNEVFTENTEIALFDSFQVEVISSSVTPI